MNAETLMDKCASAVCGHFEATEEGLSARQILDALRAGAHGDEAKVATYKDVQAALRRLEAEHTLMSDAPIDPRGARVFRPFALEDTARPSKPTAAPAAGSNGKSAPAARSKRKPAPAPSSSSSSSRIKNVPVRCKTATGTSLHQHCLAVSSKARKPLQKAATIEDIIQIAKTHMEPSAYGQLLELHARNPKQALRYWRTIRREATR